MGFKFHWHYLIFRVGVCFPMALFQYPLILIFRSLLCTVLHPESLSTYSWPMSSKKKCCLVNLVVGFRDGLYIFILINLRNRRALVPWFLGVSHSQRFCLPMAILDLYWFGTSKHSYPSHRVGVLFCSFLSVAIF